MSARGGVLSDRLPGGGPALAFGERHFLRSIPVLCLHVSAAGLARRQNQRPGGGFPVTGGNQYPSREATPDISQLRSGWTGPVRWTEIILLTGWGLPRPRDARRRPLPNHRFIHHTRRLPVQCHQLLPTHNHWNLSLFFVIAYETGERARPGCRGGRPRPPPRARRREQSPFLPVSAPKGRPRSAVKHLRLEIEGSESHFVHAAILSKLRVFRLFRR